MSAREDRNMRRLINSEVPRKLADACYEIQKAIDDVNRTPNQKLDQYLPKLNKMLTVCRNAKDELSQIINRM